MTDKEEVMREALQHITAGHDAVCTGCGWMTTTICTALMLLGLCMAGVACWAQWGRG